MSKTTMLMTLVHEDVWLERERQNEKWGFQRHDYGTWLMILTEEVGEVAQVMQKNKGWGKPTDADDLYTELIHVAAVASAIAEQVKELKASNNGDSESGWLIRYKNGQEVILSEFAYKNLVLEKSSRNIDLIEHWLNLKALIENKPHVECIV